MKTNSILAAVTIIFSCLLNACSENNKPAPVANEQTSEPEYPELYEEIRVQDSLMFSAYNRHDVEAMMKFMSDSVEFYHDTGGLSGFKESMEGLKSLFASGNANDIRRDLVTGSMEVYPVKDYGAIQTGHHTFCHTENGKPDCGTFKFLHIWQKKDGVWKITRVASYGHKIN